MSGVLGRHGCQVWHLASHHLQHHGGGDGVVGGGGKVAEPDLWRGGVLLGGPGPRYRDAAPPRLPSARWRAGLHWPDSPHRQVGQQRRPDRQGTPLVPWSDGITSSSKASNCFWENVPFLAFSNLDRSTRIPRSFPRFTICC